MAIIIQPVIPIISHHSALDFPSPRRHMQRTQSSPEVSLRATAGLSAVAPAEAVRRAQGHHGV